MKPTPPRIDEATARRLAVVASCDPRSIRRAFAGLPVRGLAGERARAALQAEGLLPAAAAQAEAPAELGAA